MKKLIVICVTLLILALSACRSDDFESVPYAPAADGSFSLPMTGGGFSLRRTNQEAANFSMAYDTEVFVAEVQEEPPGGQVVWEDIAGQGQRHVIQNADVEMETEDFDDIVTALRLKAPATGGYIESEMLSNRDRRIFTIVLRIPAAEFDAVLRQVESLAYVRTTNQRAQDVTESFYDMVGNLELRRIEEERLLALIEDAENINEILALEARLSTTRLSIESYTAQLNNMAGQIRYSTIVVMLFDIATHEDTATPYTLGERVGGAFGDSLDGTVSAVQGIIVFFAGAMIPLALLAATAFGLYVLAKKFVGIAKKIKTIESTSV